MHDGNFDVFDFCVVVVALPLLTIYRAFQHDRFEMIPEMIPGMVVALDSEHEVTNKRPSWFVTVDWDFDAGKIKWKRLEREVRSHTVNIPCLLSQSSSDNAPKNKRTSLIDYFRLMFPLFQLEVMSRCTNEELAKGSKKETTFSSKASLWATKVPARSFGKIKTGTSRSSFDILIRYCT
jgi:hypothetical protein